MSTTYIPLFADPVRRESVFGYVLLADVIVVNKRHGRGLADIVREKYGSDVNTDTVCSRVSLLCACVVL